jgi:hypothetical protein
MGVILTGIVAAVVIAIGAGFVLRGEQKEAWQVYSTSGARVGDPGSNLVGSRWTGNPSPADVAAGEEPAT